MTVLPSPVHVSATDGLRLWGQRVIAKAVGEVIGLVAVAGGGFRAPYLFTRQQVAVQTVPRVAAAMAYLAGRPVQVGLKVALLCRMYPRAPGIIFEALSMSCGGNVDAYQKGHRHAQQAYSRSHGF